MAVTRADGVHMDAKMAGDDLSAASNLYKSCKIDTDGRIILTTAITDYCAGSIVECAAEDNPVTYQTDGLAKFVADGAIAYGARVMPSTTAGKVTTAAGATALSIGMARSSTSADGEIVEVQIDRTRGAA